MGRDVPDDAYFEADCPTHGRTTFVDLMGDDFCVECLGDADDEESEKEAVAVRPEETTDA